MKIFTLALLCALACTACAKPLKTLSDGQPGYAIHCETVRQRCLDEIALLCRGKGYMIVTERAQEVNIKPDWVDAGLMYDPGGVHPKFNSRYWMEMRCDQF